jgi:NAD(P)-dependent dehydrogenase (short-subunit alcohol dehydrogenase family)
MPGTHATDRMEYLVERSVDQGQYDTYEESMAAWTEEVPLERMGDPERFGQVVAFLTSEPAGYVNGEAVMVDGGDARSNL